ncbi:MAG: ABC transporter permease [Pseudomonadales bacterium]|nr:ABC transporter permease [Pseudomonadales bacterium]
MKFFRRSKALAVKETRELFRDPTYLGLSFFIPVLLLQLFGYGLSLDVKNLPIVFVDTNNSSISREYIDSFVHSEYFDLIDITRNAEQAHELMQRGTARVVVELPTNFSRNLVSGKSVAVAVTVDGSFPTRASIIQSYISAINAKNNLELIQQMADQYGLNADALMPIEMRLSVWYNPALESINMIVPGILVLILMLFPAILGALLVVREKEDGTIFNLYSSPIRSWEIVLGKAAPYVVVSFIDYLIIYAASILQFDVRFVGSFWVISSAALLYCICTIGMGLLFSIITQTQLAAMLLTFLLTVTPAFSYSGFTTPIASMDSLGQFIAHLIPATYFMDIVRGSYLKGLGFEHYASDIASLAIYTAAIYTLCIALLKKRIG